MSGPSEKDRELDAYLRGDSDLSRAYKEHAPELPPPHVDAQILAEAHRADAASPKPRTRGPFSGSWMVPASVTAVVVLAVSVAVLLPEGRPGYERQRDRFEDAAAPAPDAPAAEKLQQRESKQAPAASYAPPPPGALESESATAGAAQPKASQVAPAEPVAPALEQRSLMKKESAPAAPTDFVQPDAARAGDSSRKRSDAPGGEGAAIEEGVAGRARSEVLMQANAWLDRIEMMIARGELEAARASLAEFRRVYPQAEVRREIIEALADSGN